MNGNGLRDDEDLHYLAFKVSQWRPNLSVAAVGCGITSLALAANAVNGSTKTPEDLYAELRTTVFISPSGSFEFKGLTSEAGRLFKFAGLAHDVPRFTGLNVKWDVAAKVLKVRIGDSMAVNVSKLRNALDQCKVAIMFDGGHYSVIDRYKDNGGTLEFYEQDPNYTDAWIGANSPDFAKFRTMRFVSAQQQQPTPASGHGSPLQDLRIHVTGARRVLVTDPLGNSLGIDPVTGEPADSLPGGFGVDYAPGTPDDVLTDEEFAELEAYSPREFVMDTPTEGIYQIGVGDLFDEQIDLRGVWTPTEGHSVEETASATFPSGIGQFTLEVLAPPPCPADVDDSGVVGRDDFDALLEAWGSCPGGPEPCPADVDGDGQVGIVDLLELLANWGTCP